MMCVQSFVRNAGTGAGRERGMCEYSAAESQWCSEGRMALHGCCVD